MIVFTLCSNNYLAMARALVRSLQEFAPSAKIVIGLVDRKSPDVDYTVLAPAEIVPVSEIGIPDFESMVIRYRIIELNTAIKPYLFKYLFARQGHKEGEIVLYFDPDIKLFAPLDPLLAQLEGHNLLLTPHILAPIPESFAPYGDNIFLNYGIYNLGFAGMRWSEETGRLLDWWGNHLLTNCKNDTKNGFFVDQLWMNLAPLFFKGVNVTFHKGMNVAYWNLHERRLNQRGDRWYVDDQVPLIFYHFSSFEINKPNSLGYHCENYDLNSRPEMRPLFDAYRAELTGYRYQKLRQMPCAYVQDRRLYFDNLNRAYYRRYPWRWCLSLFKRAVPKKVITSLREPSPADDFLV